MKRKMTMIPLILSMAAAIVFCGCGASTSTEQNPTDRAAQAALRESDSSEETPEELTVHPMIYVNGSCLISTGREAILPASKEADGTITEIITDGKLPSADGQANFDCLGSPYTILADGAAALRLDGNAVLFLADDTAEYEGIYKKKKDLSEDTLTWLKFYDSLSQGERLALSIVPAEFADERRSLTGQPDYFTDASAEETTVSLPSYIAALTEEELTETEDLIQNYFTEETPYYEGVDQLYPVDAENTLYQNAGLEGEYTPGNIIIYKVLTVRDRRDGNPFRSVSVARNNKSSDWKIINSGF